ncbi:DUF6049 family protein [Ruicaihuangia caeni]|uniref:DUF6049 family protein n=1 Tax=Ruicaihuangia caeni TaxID=3042517 RepID=UPI00338E8BB1
MTLLRALLALVVGLAGVLVLPSASIAEEAASITVTAAPTTSALLRPSAPLRVDVALTNPGSAELEAVTVELQLQREPITNAEALDQWLTGEDSALDRDLDTLTATSPISIAPRSTSRLAVVTEPETILLDEARPGVYPVAVVVASASERISSTRTAIVWKPDELGSRVGLSLVTPITIPEPTGALLTADELALLTSPGGLLAERLDAMAGRSVALGIDPMVAASIRALGTQAPQSATDWLQRLEALTNDTFALMYADADAAAMLQAGVPLLQPTGFALDPANFGTAEPTTEPDQPTEPGSPPDSGQDTPALPTTEELLSVPASLGAVWWPAADTVTPSDAQTLTESGSDRILLSSSNVEAVDRTPVARIGGGIALVSDDRITSMLDTTLEAGTPAEWNESAAHLAAALAIEAGSRTSPVIAALDRESSAAPQRLADTLNVLAGLPWVTPTALSAVNTGDSIPSASVAERPQSADRIAAISGMVASERQVAAFATAAVDTAAIVDARRLALLGTLSQSWRMNASGWEAVVDQFMAENRSIVDSVEVVERGQILVLADRTELPINVRNELGQAVEVVLDVRALTAGLAVEQQRTVVVVEPASTRNVPVPVQSIANGAVMVELTLTSTTGVPLGSPVFVRVNVQAGWETAGTVIAASVVVLVFIIGIARTVLKRRRATEEADD